MKKELLFIHGLGSGVDSRKYKLLKETFHTTHNCYCAAWDSETDIKALLAESLERYESESELVLIGDSTGGNYAYQLREQLTAKGVEVRLLLLNPLLNIAYRIASFPFPDSLVDSLIALEQVDDCFLLQSYEDEVIDQSKIKVGHNVEQFKVDDSHRLLKLEEHMLFITQYIEFK